MLSLAIVAVFFLMLLAPCVLALVNGRRRDDADSGRIEAQLTAAMQPAQRFVWTEVTEDAPPVEAPPATFVPAEVLSALGAAQAEAEYTQAEAASTTLEVATLRQQLAAAQEQALMTRMVAAKARAAALAIASKAAAERAEAAAERAQAARQVSEQASLAATAARDAARQRAKASEAANDAANANPDAPSEVERADHPALHYPRARTSRRAA